jgi:hypothetical protein
MSTRIRKFEKKHASEKCRLGPHDIVGKRREQQSQTNAEMSDDRSGGRILGPRNFASKVITTNASPHWDPPPPIPLFVGCYFGRRRHFFSVRQVV